MPHEKDRRAGRTYVEPGELTARERDRERRRRRQADGATGDQQEPDPSSDSVREDDTPHPA
ncbi:MAG: hypothetical protein QM598_12055 [Protaetiibacter sp.]